MVTKIDSIGDIRLNVHKLRLHSSQSGQWLDGRRHLSFDHHAGLLIVVLGEIIQLGSNAELRSSIEQLKNVIEGSNPNVDRSTWSG